MIKLLLYCTKAKPYLRVYPFDLSNSFFQLTKDNFNALNGKIVAECDCDKVEKFYMENQGNFRHLAEIMDKSCLNTFDLINYQGENDYLYALHLSNVNVFDEPKELAKHTLDNNSDYYVKKWIKKFDSFKGSALTKAPQNMCNVYDKNCNHYILISIQPQHLCKILNGEKTIEVRRKILNCMKEVIDNEDRRES